MTFYEAALRVLEAEGRPLHFLEITEKSIQQNLLSHVGKTPEQTMLSRLAAMARRARDRRVIVTSKDTFALAEWQIPENPEALQQTGVPEPNPEEDLPPLRPPERHPDPRNDNVRAAGRAERGGKRHREEEDAGRRGRRRFPPIPEVAFEILADAAEGMRAERLLEVAKERDLGGEDLSTEQVLTALLEDNQRRIDAGRRPQFVLERESGLLKLERAGQPSETPPQELQAAFAAALGIPLEGGRPVLGRPSAARAEAEEGEVSLAAAAKAAVKDARKSIARALRRKLMDLEVGTFEKSVVKMLHGLGFRELKVAKRSKDGPLLTARRREGSVELRFAVRMLKGSQAVDRRAVQELRRDLGHYSAQVGLLTCPGEVRGDAKTEAQASGSLVMLWCGDALAEKFIEARAGVTATVLELYEVDDRFFEAARIDAEEAARKREERQREKQQREREEPRAAAPAREEEAASGTEPAAPAAAPLPEGGMEAGAPPPEVEGDEGDDADGEEEDDSLPEQGATAGEGGGEGQPGPAAPGGERRRRRRRRRGRRGRGGREGAPGQTGQPGQPGPAGQAGPPQATAGGPPAESAPAAAATAAAPPPPSPPEPAPPSSGGGEGPQS
jgi:hypothetical protein